MNGFEFNKLMGAFLFALLVAMIASFVGREAVHPEMPEKKAYIVEGITVVAEANASDAAPAAGPAPIAALLAKADAAAGQKSARVCTSCHSFEKGGANKVGPNLYGVVMAKHGNASGFSYSEVIKGMAAKKWGYEELSQFLYNPRAYAPGTKMSFAGIKSDADRANVIAYLRTLADSPAALPSGK